VSNALNLGGVIELTTHIVKRAILLNENNHRLDLIKEAYDVSGSEEKTDETNQEATFCRMKLQSFSSLFGWTATAEPAAKARDNRRERRAIVDDLLEGRRFLRGGRGVRVGKCKEKRGMDSTFIEIILENHLNPNLR
jgi:hypothetical protein